MVKTYVTFADFFRERPLIFETDSERFFLVFEGDRVQLRETWPSAQGSTGLVLQLDCVFTGEEESRQLSGWKLQVHQDSPRGLFMINFDGGIYEEWDNLVAPGQSVDDVRRGDVLGFSMEGELMIRIHRMMLNAEEEQPDEDEAEAMGPQPFPLLRVPLELLAKIVSYLPIATILNSACFVSPRMFYAAKAVRNWPEVDMTTGIKCRNDVESLYRLISPTCKELRGAICHHLLVGEQDVEMASLGEHNWRKLKKMSLRWSLREHFIQTVFLGALRNGNFSSLESLNILPELEPDELNGWVTPALKELTLRLSTLCKSDIQEPGPQLPQLQKLRIQGQCDVIRDLVSHQCFITTARAQGLLPNLEELKVDGSYRGVYQETFHLPFLSSLKRLDLNYRFHPIDSKAEVEVDMAEMLNGSNLRSLTLSEKFLLNGWETVSSSSLENLTELSIAISAPIPYSSMPNLEAARIEVLETTPGDQRVITDLLPLPKLKILFLRGQNVLRRLAGEVTTPTQIKNLTLMGSKTDFGTMAEIEDLCSLLESMPTLARLHFEADEILQPKVIGHLVRSAAESLVSLVITSASRPQNMRFAESVTELCETLSRDWRLGGPETASVRPDEWPMILHACRPDEQFLDKKDLLRFHWDRFND